MFPASATGLVLRQPTLAYSLRKHRECPTVPVAPVVSVHRRPYSSSPRRRHVRAGPVPSAKKYPDPPSANRARFNELSLLASTMKAIKVITRFRNELSRQAIIALDAAIKERHVRDVSYAMRPCRRRSLVLAENVDTTRLRWFMTAREFSKIRALKDSTGRLLMTPDPTASARSSCSAARSRLPRPCPPQPEPRTSSAPPSWGHVPDRARGRLADAWVEDGAQEGVDFGAVESDEAWSEPVGDELALGDAASEGAGADAGARGCCCERLVGDWGRSVRRGHVGLLSVSIVVRLGFFGGRLTAG